MIVIKEFYTRQELIDILEIDLSNVRRGLKKLNASNSYKETGKTLSNGRPEKAYIFTDLPKKWQKKITEHFQSKEQSVQDTKPKQETEKSSRSSQPASAHVNNRHEIEIKKFLPADERYVLSVEEVADLVYKKPRTIREWCHDGKLTCEKDGNGYKIGLSSFAVSIQNRYLDQKMKVTQQREFQKLGLTPDMLQNDKLKRKIMAVSEAESRPMGVSAEDWYETVGKKYGRSKKTIYKWIDDIRGMRAAENIYPVFDGFSIQIQSSKFCQNSIDKIIKLIINNPRTSINVLYDELIASAKEHGWRVGESKTFYTVVKNIKKQIAPLLTEGKGGRLGMETKISPAIRRDLFKYDALEVIVGDQHIFDWMVFNDDGEAIRPQMYMWVDMRSRFWLGVSPTLDNYNKYNVALSLMEACKFGTPGAIYTDLGKSELSKYVESTRKQLSGLTALGDWDDYFEQDPAAVEHKKARGRWPRTKPIENHFMHFERMLQDKMGGLGYCKRQNDEKDNEHLQKVLNRQIKNGELLHWKEFFEIVRDVVDKWNSHIMTEYNIIPEDNFFDSLAKNPKQPFTSETLEFMFLPAEKRKVYQSKIGIKYGKTKLEYHAPELSRYVNQNVEVRFNPLDIETVHILDIETQEIIATASLWERVNPKDIEAIRKKGAEQQKLMRHWMKIKKKYTDKASKIVKVSKHYTKTAIEAKKDVEAKKEIKKINSKATKDKAVVAFVGAWQKASGE